MTDDREAARVPHRRRSGLSCAQGHRTGATPAGRGGGNEDGRPVGNEGGRPVGQGDGKVSAMRCLMGEAAQTGAVMLEIMPLTPRGPVAVVKVTGEIDLRTADQLKIGLLGVVESGFGRIIVDFEGVRFCDATGLGALVAAHNRLVAAGGGLGLARVRPAQRRIFRITGLDRLFTLHESVEEAVHGGHAPSTATQS